MLSGTALRCHTKALQFRVWSGRSSPHSDHCSARVSTRGTVPQLIERSASVRSRRNGSSTVDQDSPAEPKVVAGAAELVEDGPILLHCGTPQHTLYPAKGRGVRGAAPRGKFDLYEPF